MIIKDNISRLIYFDGNYSLNRAIDSNGGEIFLEKGQTRYLARLELAAPDYPEISENQVLFDVFTTWNDVYWQKGNHGAIRGFSSGLITFEELVREKRPPQKRADRTNHSELRDELADLFAGNHFNLNLRIYSEVDGKEFHRNLNNLKTYQSVFTDILGQLNNYWS